MYTWRDPELGGLYKWQSRRQSHVIIESKVPLIKGRDWLALRLRIQRRFLDLLFRETQLQGEEGWFDRALKEVLAAEGVSQQVNNNIKLPGQRVYYFCREIACRLRDLAEKAPPHRKQTISLPVLRDLKEARFAVSRDSLLLLRDFFSWPAPEGWTHIANLSMRIMVFFLNENILKRILKPARGRWAGKQVLGDFLPGAYFACRRLVLAAQEDTDIDQSIKTALDQLAEIDHAAKVWLNEMQNLPDSYRDQAEITLLVYRAFYGAWERYGLEGLPEPQEASRRRVYGRKRRRLTNLFPTADQYPDIKQDVLDYWQEVYLGEIGAAAKVFHLV